MTPSAGHHGDILFIHFHIYMLSVFHLLRDQYRRTDHREGAQEKTH